MSLASTIGIQRFVFGSLKEVLAKANEEKAGDRLAGIAASCQLERVAAKQVLAETALSDLRSNPVLPGEDDEITRLIDDSLDEAAWTKIKSFCVGELREFLLSSRTKDEEIEGIAWGLNGEMAAAVAKLMSNLDLVRRRFPLSRGGNSQHHPWANPERWRRACSRIIRPIRRKASSPPYTRDFPTVSAMR